MIAVAETAPLHVQLIAKTEFFAPPDVPWSTDADGGQALVEFAGRACYQSWSKPNPKTATNAGYLRHIIDVGHFSVLEHASVSFYITGISRSCTHELIRHRHFSYSQLSQRYVPENDSQVVVPPGMEDDPELQRDPRRCRRRQPRHLRRAADQAGSQVRAINPTPCLRRKQARQAARAVLPNATETRIVVTGNYRAWRHFIAMRASEHADVEIRRLAIAVPASAHRRGARGVRRLRDRDCWPTARRSRPVRWPPKLKKKPPTRRAMWLCPRQFDCLVRDMLRRHRSASFLHRI